MTDNKAPTAKSYTDTGNKAFIPEHYACPDQQALFDYIAKQPMCQLISGSGDEILCSAVPLIPDPRHTGRYLGHFARRNAQTQAVDDGLKALAVFSGPHAYISPRWFIDSNTVPTWNYLTIQLRGQLQAVDEPELHFIMRHTVDYMETLLQQQDPHHQSWQLDEAPKEVYERLVPGITAFHLQIDSIEGIKRFNQDKTLVDIKAIMAGLTNTKSNTNYSLLEHMAQEFDQHL